MTRQNKSRTHNSTFAIGGVSFSADSLGVAESFVLRINICGKNPAHRKSAKRCKKPCEKRYGYENNKKETENKFYSNKKHK